MNKSSYNQDLLTKDKIVPKIDNITFLKSMYTPPHIYLSTLFKPKVYK